MAFSLVHFNLHLFLHNTKGIDFDIWSRYNPPYNAAIDMSYPFAKDSSSSDATVTIHGLTRKHAQLFTKGSLVTIYAGWSNSDGSQNNYHQIFSEKIKETASTNNESGDIQTSFTCTDGEDDSKEESLSKIKSKNVRANASDRISDRSQITAINKIFGKKRISLTNFLRNKRGLIRSARNKIHDEKDSIMQQRHKWVEYFKAEDNALKGKRKGGATIKRREIQQARAAKRTELSNEDHQLTNLSKGLTARSKSLSAYGKRKHRNIRNAERYRKTRIKSKYERAKRTRSKRRSKSIKRKNGKHFRKGTKASAIISTLARMGHLKIYKMNLVHNKRYNSGYTADKTPRQCIRDVVKDCDSSIWYAHGQMVIGDFANHTSTPFTLTNSTGMISSPQAQDADDDDNSGVITYSVTCIFLPFVTAGSKFRIVDPEYPLYDDIDHKEPVNVGSYFNDEVIVQSGESDVNSGDTPTTSLTVIRASDARKYEKSVNTSRNRKAKKARIKNRKDARSRKHIKAKRHARQHARIRRHAA